MIVLSRECVAVEVRLSDCAALNVFRSLHDVYALDQFSDERATRPAMFHMFGHDYVHAQEGASQ